MTPQTDAKMALKPCPFCGGEAELGKTVKSAGGGYYFPVHWAGCKTCKNVYKSKGDHNRIYDVVMHDEEFENQVIKEWNTRALEAQTDNEKVEELVSAIRETQSLLAAMFHEQRPWSEIQVQIDDNNKALGPFGYGPYADLENRPDLVKTDNAGVGDDAWLPMETSPMGTGEPVLLKFKDELSQYAGYDGARLERWQGLQFVGRSPHKDHKRMGWQFAAPVGHGGFPNAWLDGWKPLKRLSSPPDGFVMVRKSSIESVFGSAERLGLNIIETKALLGELLGGCYNAAQTKQENGVG